jgi:hypothetical protein
VGLVKNYYIIEVLDGVYFAQFKGKKESLVYTVDQEEAWKTSNHQAAQNMNLCLQRLYNLTSKVIIYDQFPVIPKTNKDLLA